MLPELQSLQEQQEPAHPPDTPARAELLRCSRMQELREINSRMAHRGNLSPDADPVAAAQEALVRLGALVEGAGMGVKQEGQVR